MERKCRSGAVDRVHWTSLRTSESCPMFVLEAHRWPSLSLSLVRTIAVRMLSIRLVQNGVVYPRSEVTAMYYELLRMSFHETLACKQARLYLMNRNTINIRQAFGRTSSWDYIKDWGTHKSFGSDSVVSYGDDKNAGLSGWYYKVIQYDQTNSFTTPSATQQVGNII